MPNSGYFDTVFATGGDLNTIPDATQPSGSVSYEQGFPVLYSTPVASGGLNVPRTAINQVLNDITAAIQYNQQGNFAPFITSSMNGGTPYSYSQYAVVLYFGVAYISLVNANTDTPPSAKWSSFSLRQSLTGAANYYVATTGNDSTGNGTSGSPWATIQHAINFIANSVDLAGNVATINVANGTYSVGGAANSPFTGAGTTGGVQINGNNVTPSSCVVTATGTAAFAANNGAIFSLEGFDVSSSGSGGFGLLATNGGQINVTGLMQYGSETTFDLSASDNGEINVTGNYTISGAKTSHMAAQRGGVIKVTGVAITLATPTVSNGFAYTNDGGVVYCPSVTFSGSATGIRYLSNGNGVIDTQGGGSTYLPGSSAGATATGGQYI